MGKRGDLESKLVAAAEAFDEQLAAYGRLAELLLRTPLATAKQLERVNQTLTEIVATEERLAQTGRALALEVKEAHQHQQALAERMSAHVPEIARRNAELREIIAELQEIGEVTREINLSATGGDTAMLEIEERVGGLAARAEGLAARAHAAGFEDVGNQAHAVQQQLVALGRKLHSVTSRVS